MRSAQEYRRHSVRGVALRRERQLQTTSLMDYLVPTACEMPAVRTAHMVTPSPYILLATGE